MTHLLVGLLAGLKAVNQRGSSVMVKVGQEGWEVGLRSAQPSVRMLTVTTFLKVSHISDVSELHQALVQFGIA